LIDQTLFMSQNEKDIQQYLCCTINPALKGHMGRYFNCHKERSTRKDGCV